MIIFISVMIVIELTLAITGMLMARRGRQTVNLSLARHGFLVSLIGFVMSIPVLLLAVAQL